MLTITVIGTEHFNEESQEFTTEGDVVLQLEHSLATLSKWEALYEKPFLGKEDKTTEEVIAYIKIMTQTPNVPPEVFSRLSAQNYQTINEYINSKQSATWFREISNSKSNSEVVTSELIYYWMMSANVPLECEHWHLNRLFTLLRVFGAKNGKQKKMSRGEIAARNAALNEQRRREMGTRG